MNKKFLTSICQDVGVRANITGQQIQISKSDIGSGLYFLSVLHGNDKRVLTTKLFVA